MVSGPRGSLQPPQKLLRVSEPDCGRNGLGATATPSGEAQDPEAS